MSHASHLTTRDAIARYRRSWPADSFLALLTDDVCLDLFRAGRPATFGSGEPLIRQGGADDHVILLVEACVKVTADLGSAGEALLAIRVGGDIVGELAGAGRTQRMATVRSCTRQPVVAALVDAPAFARLQGLHPQISAALAYTMAKKLRFATQRRVDIAHSSPLVRLARVLVALADDYGQPHGNGHVLITVNLTQPELGSLVGVSEPTVQRTLRELRRRGAVDSGRRPIVKDALLLREIAELPIT